MRTTVLFVVALVVLGASAPLVAGSDTGRLSPGGTDAATVGASDNAGDANDTSMPPGAQLAGVVNVQAAAVEGEIQRRSLALRLAAADSNSSLADVVTTQTSELQQRLAELQERKQALSAAERNGTIAPSRFRAEMAGVDAEIATLRGLVNATADAARSLPAEELASSDVDVTGIVELRENASNLTGPAVEDIAGPALNASDGILTGDDGLLGNATTSPLDDDDGLLGNATTSPLGDDDGDGVTTEPLENATNGTATTDVLNTTDATNVTTTDILNTTDATVTTDLLGTNDTTDGTTADDATSTDTSNLTTDDLLSTTTATTDGLLSTSATATTTSTTDVNTTTSGGLL